MSWEAVTWASKQRMKLPHEQLILLVLANCADPEGVAFSEWKGREHWWKYLVDRTRLSKSSLFRHINTLLELRLCTRDLVVLADGTRRPTIRLDLSAHFDIKEFEALHSRQRDQSHCETDEQDDVEGDENTNDISDYCDENSVVPAQSHCETSPTGGTVPFPIVGMHKDSISDSKGIPPTPQGGTSAATFEDFQKVWLRPIERFSFAKAAWDRIPTAQRGEVITAARGYWAFVGKQPKEPPLVSAQTFLRENHGWAQWFRYAPDADGAPSSVARNLHAVGSDEGKAIIAVHDLAGLGYYLRDKMIRGGFVSYLLPITPRLAALSQAPPLAEWVTLTRQQAAAWEGLLRETVAVQVRKHLKESDRAPWPWPPSAEGKIYATGPPETLMTEQDVEDFK